MADNCERNIDRPTSDRQELSPLHRAKRDGTRPKEATELIHAKKHETEKTPDRVCRGSCASRKRYETESAPRSRFGRRAPRVPAGGAAQDLSGQRRNLRSLRR